MERKEKKKEIKFEIIFRSIPYTSWPDFHDISITELYIYIYCRNNIFKAGSANLRSSK